MAQQVEIDPAVLMGEADAAGVMIVAPNLVYWWLGHRERGAGGLTRQRVGADQCRAGRQRDA